MLSRAQENRRLLKKWRKVGRLALQAHLAAAVTTKQERRAGCLRMCRRFRKALAVARHSAEQRARCLRLARRTWGRA